MRNNMKNSTCLVLFAIVAIFAFASPVKAGFIDINGGSSWVGWNSVGNSQTSGIWVLGSTSRTYNIYSTSFVLDASQTASGTGNNTASLFSNSWQAGDRIVGVGIQYTGGDRGNQFYFHTDTGAVNIKAASSFGAGNGVYSADAGDTSSHMFTNNLSGAGKVRQYSVFNGFTSNGGSNFIIPYGVGSDSTPVRSFAVGQMLGSGGTQTFYSDSVQWLMNIDAVLRSNNGATFGEGGFGSTLRVGLREQDIYGFGGGDGQSQQVFSVSVVPEPGASSLLFLGLTSFVARFRRREESEVNRLN